jgi:thiamine-phosphate pyrophosphorylase
MRARQTLPMLWLLSDERNDAALEQALARLPRGSGFVFRHYHLEGAARRARFDQLAQLARSFDHRVIVAAGGNDVTDWGADGLYGASSALSDVSQTHLKLATAHDAAEIAEANRAGADAVFLSPVFPTRSHPGATALGMDEFHRLAALSEVPVIALGGMTFDKAAQLGWPRWAAIDALS